MSQNDEIEALLRRAAPICLEVALDAQRAATEVMSTDAAKKHLTRTAAANQIRGLAQWRIVGDALVRRHSELPSELRLSTSDAQQNQGLYYFTSTSPAVVLTVRRDPHHEDEQPQALQMQMEAVLKEVEVDLGGPVARVYLKVPSMSGEPRFEVAAQGEPLSYKLHDLLDEGSGDVATPVLNLPSAPASGAIVRSTEDAERVGEQEGADSSQR